MHEKFAYLYFGREKIVHFTSDPGLSVTVHFIFTLREPNVYKPHFFLFGLPRMFRLLLCYCLVLSLFVFCGKKDINFVKNSKKKS